MVYSPVCFAGTRADSVVTGYGMEMVGSGADIREAAPERFERNRTPHSEQDCYFCNDKDGGRLGICDDRRNLATEYPKWILPLRTGFS